MKSGGTSASAPIFAAVIAAVNDARIAQGKGTVGFINPAVRFSPEAACNEVLMLASVVLCSVRGCIQRRDKRDEPGLQHERVRRCAGMGSCYGLGHAELQVAACAVHVSPVSPTIALHGTMETRGRSCEVGEPRWRTLRRQRLTMTMTQRWTTYR